jgi:hypothetical protein
MSVVSTVQGKAVNANEVLYISGKFCETLIFLKVRFGQCVLITVYCERVKTNWLLRTVCNKELIMTKSELQPTDYGEKVW